MPVKWVPQGDEVAIFFSQPCVSTMWDDYPLGIKFLSVNGDIRSESLFFSACMPSYEGGWVNDEFIFSDEDGSLNIPTAHNSKIKLPQGILENVHWSTSNKYAIVTMRENCEANSERKIWLFTGSDELTEIIGNVSFAQWLPQNEKFIVFSDNKLLISDTLDPLSLSQVNLLDKQTLELLIGSIAISPDGNVIAFSTLHADKEITTVYVYDIANHQVARLPINQAGFWVQRIDFSPKGRYMVLGLCESSRDFCLFDRETSTIIGIDYDIQLTYGSEILWHEDEKWFFIADRIDFIGR